MKRFAGALLRQLADRLDPPVFQSVNFEWRDSRDSEEARQEAAFSIIDPDALGFFLLLVKGSDADAVIQLQSDVLPEYWPALITVMADVIREARSVRG